MKKVIYYLGSIIFLLSLNAIPIHANSEVSKTTNIVQQEYIGIVPYSDVIETKYRIYGNLLQERRWNSTRGYWVDPNWITISVAN